MTRKLKVLGLALMAVFAMSIVGAQAASAAEVEHEFLSDSNPTILKATDEPETNHTFTVGGFATVECEVAHFTGTSVGNVENEADTITMHPSYTDCSFFEEEATVDTSGCDYIFDSDTPNGSSADVFVECESTGIVIDTAACTIWVGEQTTNPGVTYTNVANGDVTVNASISGIEADFHEGPLCDLLTDNGTITGEYNGLAIVEGFSDPGEDPTDIAIGATP